MNRRHFLASLGLATTSITGYTIFQTINTTNRTIAASSNLETPRDFSLRDNQTVTIPIESFTVQTENLASEDLTIEARLLEDEQEITTVQDTVSITEENETFELPRLELAFTTSDLDFAEKEDEQTTELRIELDLSINTSIETTVATELFTITKLSGDIPDSDLYQEGKGEDDWQIGYQNGSPTQSKESDNLFIYAEGDNEEGTWEFDQLVDLTDFSAIEIEWENTEGENNGERAGLCISESPGERKDGQCISELSGTFSRRTDQMDVSDIDEEWWIRVYGRDSARLSSNPIYLRTYRVELIE